MGDKVLQKIIFGGLTFALSLVCVWAFCTTTAAPEAPLKHTVQRGDTVWRIARQYGLKPEEIIELNKLEKPYIIFPGQVLALGGTAPPPPVEPAPPPSSGMKHIVEKGETASGIARKYNVSSNDIIAINNLREPYVIFPGQVLTIPGFVLPKSREQDMAGLCRLPRGVRTRGWRYIVIHHSDTTTGNAAIFDRYHRRRGMENGLAYHFVIGNGKGARDGEIEVGGRWRKQLHGGHVRNQGMNEVGIGVCLVGNFQKQRPSRKQMESLTRLVSYLMTKYNIPKRRVIGHRDVRGNPTSCPGKNLSIVELRKKL